MTKKCTPTSQILVMHAAAYNHPLFLDLLYIFISLFLSFQSLIHCLTICVICYGFLIARFAVLQLTKTVCVPDILANTIWPVDDEGAST